jgi:hypothetical protein
VIPQRRPRINNYKSHSNLSKRCWVQSLIDVEINGLQKVLKSVSLRLDTLGDRTHHVRECCSQHGRRERKLKEFELTPQAGKSSMLESTECFQVSFSLLNCSIIYCYWGPPSSESAYIIFEFFRGDFSDRDLNNKAVQSCRGYQSFGDKCFFPGTASVF